MGEQRRHRMRGASPRATAALTAVVLTATVLSGCSLVGDGRQVLNILQAEAAQQAVLSAAVDELRDLDGVEEATSRFLSDGPGGDEAGIDVVANASSTPTELVAMAETARAAFASPELGSAVTSFGLTVESGSVLYFESLHPSVAELASQVIYWRAAEAAIGEELSVRLTGDGGSGQNREITPAAEPGQDSGFTDSFLDGSDELLALDDDWAGSTFWVLPGLTATPGLPSAEAFALLESIRTEFPLSNPRAPSEGALMWWQGEEYGLTVLYTQDEIREADWPEVIALAQHVIADASPEANFVYQTVTSADFAQYRFYLGECTTEVTAGPDDRELVDALAAAGTPVPTPGGPGFCTPERR